MQVFGIGTHIVETLRMARMIDRHGELFLARVFTPSEIEHCRGRKQATQQFTAYWAAKEAVLESLGTGWIAGIHWRDVEIRPTDGGGVTVAMRGGAKELVEQRRITQIHLSVSHCRTHATATAVAMCRPEEESA